MTRVSFLTTFSGRPSIQAIPRSLILLMVVSVFGVSLDLGGLRFLTQIVELIFSFKMDSFKADLKKVALDDNIGAELKLKLSKVKVPGIVIRNDSNTDFDTIKNHFTILCCMRAAAIILNCPSLSKLSTYMCQSSILLPIANTRSVWSLNPTCNTC